LFLSASEWVVNLWMKHRCLQRAKFKLRSVNNEKEWRTLNRNGSTLSLADSSSFGAKLRQFIGVPIFLDLSLATEFVTSYPYIEPVYKYQLQVVVYHTYLYVITKKYWVFNIVVAEDMWSLFEIGTSLT
jgi:hypothetical protein